MQEVRGFSPQFTSVLHLRPILARISAILAIKDTDYRDHCSRILTHDCI
jgi:hypothetical protein